MKPTCSFLSSSSSLSPIAATFSSATLTASMALFMSSRAACLFLSDSFFKDSQPRIVPIPPFRLFFLSNSSIALFSFRIMVSISLAAHSTSFSDSAMLPIVSFTTLKKTKCKTYDCLTVSTYIYIWMSRRIY